jgi:hypothetical protein
MQVWERADSNSLTLEKQQSGFTVENNHLIYAVLQNLKN